jgi:hypothetical protein
MTRLSLLVKLVWKARIAHKILIVKSTGIYKNLEVKFEHLLYDVVD